jgi:hypothetical protein
MIDDNYKEREQWFISRIGRTVYRNNYCDCLICQQIYEDGIVIKDRNHATYCHETECELTADGSPTRYFDTREEMLEFEKSIQQK